MCEQNSRVVAGGQRLLCKQAPGFGTSCRFDARERLRCAFALAASIASPLITSLALRLPSNGWAFDLGPEEQWPTFVQDGKGRGCG